MIFDFLPGLIVASGLSLALAVILDNRDRRRARLADTLADHRTEIRGQLYDQDEEAA